MIATPPATLDRRRRGPVHDHRRIFHHTGVDDAFEGRGLAGILVSEALAATRDAGLRIVAVCPIVAGYLDKHRDFADVVDPVTLDTKRFLHRAHIS
ncbi:GNAT family N-acetyltransferase [Mycobacterium sp. CVI_P3]|uniref:GNAT family N-acetyltransferase n=1 Tax=Mycobacterium pinniadriaticum TaxID=2994102 RepID=A0ABT3S829_9MYCO|nr:GNAT family N-acetyltransferase [Mycobacterium pinniadriaticum]MCX2929217.1 GNAT family N-acetyltransferase [Mycobacterium pinniadriaticum]MCX2935642.1 GNAT family N-acetyltransferase [Mycobacterium pinniadriaticum]